LFADEIRIGLKRARLRRIAWQRRDAKVEVVAGLNRDDIVVTAGQIKLRDNVPVKVAAAKGSDSGASAAAPKANAPPPPAKPSAGGSSVIAPAQAAPAKAEAAPAVPARKS